MGAEGDLPPPRRQVCAELPHQRVLRAQLEARKGVQRYNLWQDKGSGLDVYIERVKTTSMNGFK